jgi:hypothetical protein
MTDEQRSQPNSAEHTPTPWRVDGNQIVTIVEEVVDDITCVWDGADTPNWANDAAFIVKAVNNHDALVKALQEIQLIGDGASVQNEPAIRAGNIAHAALISLRTKP